MMLISFRVGDDMLAEPVAADTPDQAWLVLENRFHYTIIRE